MGLLKTTAKVAVASAVHGRVQRRQQQRWAQQDQAAAAQQVHHAPSPGPAEPHEPQPAPRQNAGVDMDVKLAQLRQLGDLREAGVLTEAEFELKKHHILTS